MQDSCSSRVAADALRENYLTLSLAIFRMRLRSRVQHRPAGRPPAFPSEWRPATFSNFLLAGKKVLSRQLTSLFPQIVAIGRNYAEHIKELNNTAPTEPFFFLKPTTSYLPSGGTLEIPRGIIAHHEGIHASLLL